MNRVDRADISSNGSPVDRLLNARSIAVIGASDDVTKLSGRPLGFLARYGFSGEVYVVNPRRSQIGGYDCLPAVENLPFGVDLALILLPAAAVVQTLAACAGRGVGAAIVIASGFTEAGNPQLQEDLKRVARETGMRVIGPNCIGVLVPESRLTATVSAQLAHSMPRPGTVSVLSQSGAWANAILQGMVARGLGLGVWVSTGNEADLGLIELAESLLSSRNTRVLALFVEALKDGETFVRLARTARRHGKPLVVRRAGISESGGSASVSHTGKLAGSGQVWRGIARQGGVIEVGSLDEMLDAVETLQALPQRADRIAILSISGGAGVVAADEVLANGMELGAYSPSTLKSLRRILGNTGVVSNPVDTTYVTEDQFAQCAQVLATDPGVDLVFCATMSLLHDYDLLATRLAAAAQVADGRLAITTLSQEDGFQDSQRAMLAAAGVLVLPSIERGLKAIASCRVHALPTPDTADMMLLDRTAAGGLSLAEAAAIPLPASLVCDSLETAKRFGREIGYPVVLKVSSPDIPHKTEVDGVCTGIGSPAELALAWERMSASIAAHAPNARIDGFEVQQQVGDGVEMILGCSRDPEFGPVMMIGWGGIHAEAMADTTFLSLPAARAEVEDAIRRLKVSRLLAGDRGSPPADITALTDLAVRVGGVFAAAPEIAEIDINPLIVRRFGEGVVAVDLLVVPAVAPTGTTKTQRKKR